ncbi:hypothetical protein CHS0354_018993 [Potamilus streckersoni]|uniref:Uncharacterized protein n=1 Tax=Potamilus streckersoni TaxID=2493646 RepID=A0AAE0SQX4_9BIVA|nr:hypothetical protein CHS0354_018993 [Potamilus streckersoni]
MTTLALFGAASVIFSVLTLREMSAIIFVGLMYVFISPGFSLYTITNESYTWMDSLDACNKINMSLANQKRVHNTTSLNPSKTEAYWIQEIEIIKMFPGVAKLSPYNVSYSITINNDNLQNKCTNDGRNIACTASENVSNNLIKFGSFNLIIGKLNGKTRYRIGVVNYTSLLNGKIFAKLKRMVVYLSTCLLLLFLTTRNVFRRKQLIKP